MKAIELIKKDFLKFDKNTSLSEIIGAFEKTGERAAVIFDKNKYIGITDRHLMLSINIDPSKTKVSSIIKKVPILKGDEEHQEIARLLLAADVLMLPVIKNSKVIGVIKSIYVLRQLTESAKRKKIKEIIGQSPVVLKETDSVSKAIQTMHKKRISRIPIVDKKGNLAGITSITDIINIFVLKHIGTHQRGGHISSKKSGSKTMQTSSPKQEKISSLPISNLASAYAWTSSQETTVAEIIKEMDKKNINCAVIVKDKKPAGIITIRDLLKLLITSSNL